MWNGGVVNEKNTNKLTNIIREFNKHVKDNQETEQVILPLGDGLTVSRKL